LSQGHHLTDSKIESDYSDFIHNVIHNPRLRIIENYRKNGRLLDIGCGNGAFLYSAKKRNWETVGIEISESNASYAKDVKKLDVYSGTIVIKVWTEDINPLTIIRNLRPKYSDNWNEKRKDIVKISTMLKKHKLLIRLRRLINLILSRFSVRDTLYVLAQRI